MTGEEKDVKSDEDSSGTKMVSNGYLCPDIIPPTTVRDFKLKKKIRIKLENKILLLIFVWSREFC